MNDAPDSDRKPLKAKCPTCLNTTCHDLIGEVVNRDADPIEGWDSSRSWQLLKCRGCECATFRKVDYFSEWEVIGYDAQGQEYLESDGTVETYFPPSGSRSAPAWLKNVPDEVQQIMHEVYSAINADSRRLAIMGARAVVDVIVRDKAGDQGSFNAGLGALKGSGYLSRANAEHLEKAIEAGHATIHRGHAPSSDDVSSVMDIIENVLQAIYQSPSAAEHLERTTPKRRSALPMADPQATPGTPLAASVPDLPPPATPNQV